MRILQICLLILLGTVSVRSQTYEGLELVRAELIADTTAVEPGKPFTAGVLLDVAPGWHVYWEYPGDAGAPTTLDWTLPAGATAGAIQWPLPHPLVEPGGIQVYAYEDQVLLITIITPPEDLDAEEFAFRVKAAWLVCEVVCVPGQAELELTLPVSNTSAPNEAARFDEYRALLPGDVNDAPFDVAWARAGDDWKISVTGIPDGGMIEFFPLPGENALAGHPEITRNGADAVIRFRGGEAMAGVVALTRDGTRTGFRTVPGGTAPTAESEASPAADGGLGMAVLLAFLGGLILNLMPCVFPVLGIKIMGFVSQTGEERGRVILHGLAYTAGILLSFWVLAGVLLVLRAGGEELGWGFQLQSPVFVYILTLILFVFGLNMSGVFEIGVSATAVGGNLMGRASMRGSFFAGILATIVATPCAAPFLATALGAALALPPAPALLLFTMIALGLASPYLLLSVFPGLVKFLPRPGQWMETFKQALAFFLYAAAAYLLWVLEGQVRGDKMLAILLGVVAVGAGCWIYGRWSGFDRTTTVRRIGIAAGLLVLAAGIWMGFPSSGRGTPETGPDAIEWIAWSPATVERLHGEGRPVYVDFTARWCATCQTNKQVVFGSRKVIDFFRSHNVAAVKADWTGQDAAITEELAKWGRSAIPFNLVYRPGEAKPEVLPELLTPGIVLEAFRNGNGPTTDN